MRLVRDLLLVLLATVSTAEADHLPKSKLAAGKPDTVLAGIDVYHTTVQQIIARWGQPDAVRDIPDQGTVAGGRDYVWKKNGDEIICGTWNNKALQSIVYSVEVRGTVGTRSTSTGRGLEIGQRLTNIVAVYGKRYAVSASKLGGRQFTIQWSDETTLYITLNAMGRVVRMHLLASTE
jgi:hypothetical protein